MIPRQRVWHGQRLTIRWCPETYHWVLRRGTYRVASNRDWEELYTLCLRIADRERREQRRRAYLAKVVPQ